MSVGQLYDVAAPGIVFGMLAGGIAVLILVTLLIALIEAVILTILRWEEFRKSLVISIIMNVISGIMGGVLLVLVPHPTILGLVFAMILSMIIEGFIMFKFRPEVLRLTLFVVILANILSYGIVIFPAFFYSQS